MQQQTPETRVAGGVIYPPTELELAAEKFCVDRGASLELDLEDGRQPWDMLWRQSTQFIVISHDKPSVTSLVNVIYRRLSPLYDSPSALHEALAYGCEKENLQSQGQITEFDMEGIKRTASIKANELARVLLQGGSEDKVRLTLGIWEPEIKPGVRINIGELLLPREDFIIRIYDFPDGKTLGEGTSEGKLPLADDEIKYIMTAVPKEPRGYFQSAAVLSFAGRIRETHSNKFQFGSDPLLKLAEYQAGASFRTVNMFIDRLLPISQVMSYIEQAIDGKKDEEADDDVRLPVRYVAFEFSPTPPDDFVRYAQSMREHLFLSLNH